MNQSLRIFLSWRSLQSHIKKRWKAISITIRVLHKGIKLFDFTNHEKHGVKDACFNH